MSREIWKHMSVTIWCHARFENIWVFQSDVTRNLKTYEWDNIGPLVPKSLLSHFGPLVPKTLLSHLLSSEARDTGWPEGETQANPVLLEDTHHLLIELSEFQDPQAAASQVDCNFLPQPVDGPDFSTMVHSPIDHVSGGKSSILLISHGCFLLFLSWFIRLDYLANLGEGAKKT